MSNASNWVLESLEPIVKPSSEPELLYYSPPSQYDLPKSKEREELNTILRDYIPRLIPRLIATLLGKENVCSVEIYNDNLYGAVALIKTNLSAKDALELWLKLIDCLPYEKYGVVLSLQWLGENNVSEGELIDYAVKIMIKSKIGPKALPGFDATRMVQEARE
jgi:hypothetical protein